MPPVGLSVSLLSSVTVKLKEDGKLFLLKISKSPNRSSVGCLKCVQFHNWFFGSIKSYTTSRTFEDWRSALNKELNTHVN